MILRHSYSIQARIRIRTILSHLQSIHAELRDASTHKHGSIGNTLLRPGSGGSFAADQLLRSAPPVESEPQTLLKSAADKK